MSRNKNIVEWADDRGILANSTPAMQMLKLTEELGELAAGIARNKNHMVKDAIGDCVVVLNILAEMYGLSLDDCVEHAWNEIASRKGLMANGVFIKETDLVVEEARERMRKAVEDYKQGKVVDLPVSEEEVLGIPNFNTAQVVRKLLAQHGVEPFYLMTVSEGDFDDDGNEQFVIRLLGDVTKP